MSKFNLKQLSRIFVRCRPEDTSAREFLARIVCQQETNPDCKIERKLTCVADIGVPGVL